MKFDKRTVGAYHLKTQINLWSKYQHEISLRSSNRKSSKTWVRAK